MSHGREFFCGKVQGASQRLKPLFIMRHVVVWLKPYPDAEPDTTCLRPRLAELGGTPRLRSGQALEAAVPTLV